MIDIRDHGGTFGGKGDKALSDIFKNHPGKNKFMVVPLGTVNNARGVSGSFNGVSMRVEQNVSFYSSQPFGSGSPVLYMQKHDNHIDQSINTYNRTYTDHNGNCPIGGAWFYAAPLTVNKDWYFVVYNSNWTTPNKTTRGIWNVQTGTFRTWTDSSIYFLGADVYGCYYVYNQSTLTIQKRNSVDDSQVYSVAVSAGVIPNVDYRIYAENSQYLYVTSSQIYTFSPSYSTNTTVNILRINKSTGAVTTLISNLVIGSNFRMFATDSQLIIHKGNYQYSVSSEPLYIYDAVTGTLSTTTLSISNAVPIMYYANKQYVVYRQFFTNTSSPNNVWSVYKLFSITSNSIIATTNHFEADSAYSGGGYQSYIFHNEGFVASWEHSKRYLLNIKEYFSQIGHTASAQYPYSIVDFIIK